MSTLNRPYTIVIRESAHIDAPLDRVFALSTSVPLVQRTLGFKPVRGVIDGHVKMGSRVLWKGWLFGLPQFHQTLITGYAAPHRDSVGTLRAFFQDTQERGRFESFHHNHHMIATDAGGTVLNDAIHYSLPFGPVGYPVAKLIMEPFIRRTLRSRFKLLRQVATNAEYRQYV